MAGMEREGISLKQGGVLAYGASLVTATPDLKRWYIVRGDKPLDEQSTRMCVSAAGRDLQLNDHRRDGTPTVRRFNFDRDKALAQCDEIAKNFIDGEEKGIGCNDYYTGLRILEEDLGERVALQGITDQETMMTIIANPENEKDFRVLATASQGATIISLRGHKFAFSAWAASAFQQPKLTLN